MNPQILYELAEILTLRDYETKARARLDEATWAYLAGGAGDEITLEDNMRAFDRWRIVPRVLADFAQASTAVRLFGRTFAHPVFVAPTAYHRLFDPEGEHATAQGAAAAESGMVLSAMAGIPLEQAAEHYGKGLWLQCYMQQDRGAAQHLCERAEAAGYEALVLTVDAPLHCFRYREQRAGFQLPSGMEAINLRGFHSHQADSRVFGGDLLKRAPGWRDVEWLCSITRLPVLLKGILSPADARTALTCGARGVIVSNHGGRVLDGVPAAFDALPDIAAAVGDSLVVMMDGGIRRGMDVCKALARGADAVLLGRPVLHSLACFGALGVAHCLRTLHTEIEAVMAIIGAPTLADLKTAELIPAPLSQWIRRV